MTSVLIIDDSPEDLEQIADLLYPEQTTRVGQCRSGSDGLSMAKEKAFDCVLLDLRLGEEDGLEVLAEFRAKYPRLPVIVLTGLGNEQVATDAFVAGAAYYLPKRDLSSETLWTAINRVIHLADTERELAAKRTAMERSNRLDAVGQLAAGIAHDFNNQLGSLRMSVELLKDAAVTERSRGQIKTALKVIDESANLATRLVALSRQGDLLASNVEIGRVLEDVRALASMSVAEQVILDIAKPDPDLIAFCDQNQLLNAIINLVLNANDAIIAKNAIGTIRIGATRQSDRAQITVEDDGIGMPDDVLGKCVDPFFTTKSDQNGTGLGLAMVQSFANQAKGQLLITSTEGQGSKVILDLPLGQVEEDRSETESAPEPGLPADGSILLVEDTHLLAMLTQDVLENEGYTVLLAPNANRALEVLSDNRDIVLMITDIKMPGRNGFELAVEVRETYPSVKIAYITGYADNPDFRSQTILGPILQKPVEPTELVAMISKMLATA